MSVLAEIASDSILDAAFAWLCKRRQNYPGHADVWNFRRDWPQDKARLRSDLLTGRYRFGLLSRIEMAIGEEVEPPPTAPPDHEDSKPENHADA